MNTENPSATSLPLPFKNRKSGLIVFGILTIVGGAVCVLFALISAMTPSLTERVPNATPPPVNTIWVGAVTYGLMAIVLIWLGIGSIMARRWARALLAIISWSFLVCGVIGSVFAAVVIPHTKEMMAAGRPPNQPPLPDSAQTAVIAGMVIFMGVFLILGPLIWALFYSGKNVRATCETHDPVIRWTDRCPLSVLALSLWLIFGGISMFGMAVAYPVAPFFGELISGNGARIYFVLLAVIWIYGGWALYRLDRGGWWVVFVALAASALSGVTTFLHHDIAEMYRLLGYSAEQVALMQRTGLSTSFMRWSSVFWTVPLLAYLLYIRKFLFKPGIAPAPTAG